MPHESTPFQHTSLDLEMSTVVYETPFGPLLDQDVNGELLVH
jgi:hypothetical protein